MRRTKRFLSCLALAAMAVMLLAGCGGDGKKPVSAANSSAPQSQISGYFSADQSLSGGTDLSEINLRDIKVKKEQSDTVITLEFVEGSFPMGMEETATKGVPKYSTQWIPGVDRLVLNISGLFYWDYKVWEDELKNTPILGIFKQIPVDDADNVLTRLYINLKDNIAYKIAEQDNHLIIYLRAMPEDEHEEYYVMLNAFDEYTNGKIPDSEGLLPTLCSDKTNVMLISKPFATEEEANTFLEQKKQSLLPSLPGKAAVINKLKNNELPVYDAKGALAAYANMPVTKTTVGETTSPVLITNGRFLCWQPDGMAYVFVTPFFMNSNDSSQATSYEKIYINKVGSTTPTLLSEFDYYNMLKAQFSDDGRYLAFLDQQKDSRSLFVYDTKSNQVFTAAEAGFGEDTANFTWGSGDKANTIYAITGEGDMLQLMAYTLQEGQEPKVDTLLEDAFSDGAMGFYNGKVYYTQYTGETAKNGVFSFDPATRATKKVCNGVDFDLNRKTGVLAVLHVVSEEDQTYDLRLFDISTNKETTIVKSKPIAESLWSGDGTRLYYTVYRDGIGDNERYTLTLNQYSTLNQQSTEVCNIIPGDMNPSDKNNELLLTCLFSQENQFFVPITYEISTGQ